MEIFKFEHKKYFYVTYKNIFYEKGDVNYET